MQVQASTLLPELALHRDQSRESLGHPARPVLARAARGGHLPDVGHPTPPILARATRGGRLPDVTHTEAGAGFRRPFIRVCVKRPGAAGSVPASSQPHVEGSARPLPTGRWAPSPAATAFTANREEHGGPRLTPRSICPPPPVPPQRWSRRPLRPRVRGPQARLSPGRRPHGSLPGRPSAHR